MLTNRGTVMNKITISQAVLGCSVGLVLMLGLSGCQSSQPEPQPQAMPACPPGTLLTTDMQCVKPRPAKPVEVDNRPIPYDPKKVDTSPIRVK